MTTYECKECHAPVLVHDGSVVKSCSCTAPVIANLTATATGRSQVAGEQK